MSDDEEFNDYESAGGHQHHHFIEKAADYQAEATVGMSLLDNYSQTMQKPPLQRFFSLDSKSIDSSPLDFNELLKNQSIDPYLIKKDKTIEGIDQSHLIHFHKHSLELQPTNLSNLTYEFTSFMGESDTTKNQLSLSSTGGQSSVNYWLQPKKEGQIVVENNISQDHFQDYNIPSNSGASAQKSDDTKLSGYQNLVDTPKTQQVHQPQITALNISNNASNIGLFDNAQNSLMPVLQNSSITSKKVEDQILTHDTNIPDIFGQEVAENKKRTDSDEFEYVQTQNSELSSNLQSQQIQPQSKDHHNQNVEPEMWPDYFHKHNQAENPSISPRKQNHTQIIEDKFNAIRQKIDPTSMQNNKTHHLKAQNQYQEDQDEFVFGQHTEYTEEFVFQEVLGHAGNLAPQSQQQEDDEFGEFSQINTHQLHHEGQLFQNISNSANLVTILSEYAESSSGPYYLSKQKQLQSFIDFLPDYSRLLASAQHS